MVRHQGRRRFAPALFDDRSALLAVPVCTSTSLKTIINRFFTLVAPSEFESLRCTGKTKSIPFGMLFVLVRHQGLEPWTP